jgi:hypothetical protein
VGLARWRRDGREIDLPLLERLVEIEIDEEAGAAVRIRPRATPAAVNLRPYEELHVEGAGPAFESARRALAAVDADEGVSPFRRESYEPALRSCQARLDPDGRFLENPAALPLNEPLPAADHLAINDRWVLFARRRSDNFVLADIRNLQNAVERAETELAGPARTLVMGPDDAPPRAPGRRSAACSARPAPARAERRTRAPRATCSSPNPSTTSRSRSSGASKPRTGS